ncbi:MAG: hypothetical protein KAW56_12180 [Candidatus Marinimicrobia bacterium]|nr:hypothetical protein [Candidatus Neomarinimicrobiota bacterium]
MYDTNALRKILTQIWTEKISLAYASGRISSEATLVAELYRYIKKYSLYNVWLEHRINLPEDKKSGPFDILITDNLNIIGAIEVKFFPGNQKKYKKDLKKLVSITKITTDTHLRTNPISGEWDENYIYKVIKNPLCVFAVIGYSDLEALYIKNIPNNILHLTGTVSSGKCEFCQRHPVSAHT